MKSPKPWFRKSTGAWYVQVLVNKKSKQICLGPDREAAFRKFAAMQLPSRGTCAELLGTYLVWVKEHRAPGTYRWYKEHADSFAAASGSEPLAALKPLHLFNWADDRKVGHTTRSGMLRAVKTAFTWAKRRGLIEISPFAEVRIPQTSPREDCLSQKQWDKVLEKAETLEDLLVTLRETGCRPLELRILEAQYVLGDTWTFPAKISKGKQCRRVVRMTAKVRTIINRLASKYPEGPLFRNSRGKPWTRNGLVQAFRRLSRRVGFRVFPYITRHTFATDALVAGVDPITVGVLMGHRDPTMVALVYQHLAQKEDHLQAALAKAVSR